jgi:hypothetical protein
MKTVYWDRRPGNFVLKDTGVAATGATFIGTRDEWNETLVDTLIDLKNMTGGTSVDAGRSAMAIIRQSVLFKKENVLSNFVLGPDGSVGGYFVVNEVVKENGHDDDSYVVMYDGAGTPVGQLVILPSQVPC